MRKRKELWIGIVMGLCLTGILLGLLFIVLQLTNKRDNEVISNVKPTVTPVASLTSGENAKQDGHDKMESFLEGNWTRTGDTQFDASVITITCTEKDKIDFIIKASSGGNSGVIQGNTELQGNNASYINIEEGYHINFTWEKDTLTVSMKGNSYGPLGQGVTIDGTYEQGTQEKKQTDFIELGIFENADELDAFQQLVKNDYQLFADTFQLCFSVEDLDGYQAEVLSGAVRGLSKKKEGIIMKGAEDLFWAAVIDDHQIKYYTNSRMSETLPVTIDRWRQDFSQLEVIMAATGELVRSLTLDDILKRDFRQMKEHSFKIKLEVFGTVDFVAGIRTEDGIKRAEYYLINSEGEVVYKFPPAEVGTFVRTRAVSFRNLDMVKPEFTKDIIIVEEYTDRDLEYGDVPFPYCRIFTEEKHGFKNRTDLYEEMNRLRQNENILVILEYYKDLIYRREFLHRENTDILMENKATLETFGDINLVAASDTIKGKKQLKLFLVDETDTIVYEFHIPIRNRISQVKQITETDINKDGREDIILLADIESEKSSKIETVSLVYLRSGNEFLYLADVNDKLNNSGSNESIEKIMEFLKGETFDLSMDDLGEQEVKIFKNYSYPVETAKWGKARLIVGQKKGIGVNYLKFYLVDKKGAILCQLPQPSRRDCNSMREVRIEDVNGDSKEDMIMIVNYTTGFGTNGVSPSPYCHVFLQSEDGFLNVEEIDQKLNYYVDNISMKNVLDYLKKIM